MIQNLYKLYTDFIWFMLKYRITTRLIDILSYCKRKLLQKKVPEEILHNIEWFKEYDIPSDRFYVNKPRWLSGVARLKNAEHFLELCMESHLPFLDELILVDNESTDKTKEICKKLQKKYPDKIKFYEYPFYTIPAWEWNGKIPTNSIHSLAYHYNRSFSKAKYSHVMKVDDDNFLIPEKRKDIRESSITSRKYNIYRWINLIKDKKWNIWVPVWYEYSWDRWDHGIYPVSPYNYYIQWEKYEVFKTNLIFKRHWFSFFHLKFLKSTHGFHNLPNNSFRKWYENRIKRWYIYNFKQILKWKDCCELDKYIKIIKSNIN